MSEEATVVCGLHYLAAGLTQSAPGLVRCVVLRMRCVCGCGEIKDLWLHPDSAREMAEGLRQCLESLEATIGPIVPPRRNTVH